MKRTLFNLLFLAICGMTTAQTLSVDDVQVLPGTTASYELKINVEGGAYSGFQYQMQFPATGFALTSNTTVLPTWQGGVLSVGDLDAEGKTNASAFSSSDKEIPAGDIVIGTVEFQVNDDVALGEYDVTISGFDFLDGTNYVHANGGAPVTFKVKVVDHYSIVLDENSTTAPTASSEPVDVIVKRTINANNWSTICLPFAMTEEQVKTAFGNDVQLAEFTGYKATEDGEGNVVEIKVNFSDATAIAANHPCLIKVSENVTQFAVEGVDIAPEEEPTVATVKRTKKQWSEMIGTYAATTIEDQMLFLSGNKFWYSTGSSKIKGYRAWFDFYDVLTEVESSSARVSMFFDEVITDINKVSEKKSNMSGAIFDLQGRRVNKPVQGIFIKDGKKIIIEN